MIKTTNLSPILQEAINLAKKNTQGKQADYIPELASINPELTGVVLKTLDNKVYHIGDCDNDITLQSVAKMVLLAGLTEELGQEQILKKVRVEPSGTNFSSLARLDQFGPMPSNPCLNSGAIALCDLIPGEKVDQMRWLHKWFKNLFSEELHVNQTILTSEKQTGNRNRAIAFLLKSNTIITNPVKDILDVYFTLCSYQANLFQLSNFSTLIASGGINSEGERILSKETCSFMLAIMSTCGLYNESGIHLVKTGLPAKSAVSGYIMAISPQKAGLAVFSPRLTSKGNSIRGEIILEYLSKQLELHFF